MAIHIEPFQDSGNRLTFGEPVFTKKAKPNPVKFRFQHLGILSYSSSKSVSNKSTELLPTKILNAPLSTTNSPF